MRISKQQIQDHAGPIAIFCPHIEHQKSTYKRVKDKQAFLECAFDPKSVFRPRGRIEGRQMLVCMLPVAKEPS